MEIDHPEVLLVCMTIAFAVILITSYIVLKKWGVNKFDDKEVKKN